MATVKAPAQNKNNLDQITKRFLTGIQTHGPRINMDSIRQMSAAQLTDYMLVARKRATVVQVDTINVRKNSDLHGLGASGTYVPNVNAVFLNYFNPLPEFYKLAEINKDAASNLQKMNAINADLRNTVTHEIIHSEDDARFNPVGMTLSEILRHSVHMEIAAYIKELIRYSRAVYMETKDLSCAFPRGDSPLYIEYITANPNLPIIPAKKEMQIIARAGLAAAAELHDQDYAEQFAHVMVHRMAAGTVYATEMRENLAKNPTYKIDSFNTQITEMYNVAFGDEIINILDIVGPVISAQIFDLAGSVVNDMGDFVRDMESKNPDYVRQAKEWRKLYVKNTPESLVPAPSAIKKQNMR